MTWSALSPDLSPIEQLWSILDSAVKARGPWGCNELERFVVEEFDRIPQSTIDKLVLSFPSRCQRVIEAQGDTVKP
jgi:hypothetical protein